MRAAACIVAALAVLPARAAAQHEGHAGPPRREEPRSDEPGVAAGPHAAMAPAPLDVPPSREGSGTSWLPDASPMHMLAWQRGGLELDAMWNVFLQYVDEGSSRGERQLGSVNWVMAMARLGAGEGQVRARAMLSLEPLTVGRCGYPDLLATGELCRGEPLHDRQHPHDTFMELSAGFAHPVARDVAVDLYAALAGEPALGPVAFPHRISGMTIPTAPMTHHWLDSTHIAFGVVTAGVYGRRWKMEGSAFNGREPDEHRYDLDLAALDSFAGRLWFLPSPRWSLQISAGFLREAEAGAGGEPRTDVTRITASATHQRSAGRGGWATTIAWGRNAEHGEGTNAVLVESALEPDGRNVLSARLEAVEKTSEDLAIPGAGAFSRWVAKGALAYVRQWPVGVGAGRRVLLGLGAGVSVNTVPGAFENAYGTRWPVGFSVFASTRPAAMEAGAHGPR